MAVQRGSLTYLDWGWGCYNQHSILIYGLHGNTVECFDG